MNLRFKSRVALFNTFAAAITMFIVFAVVYAAVYITTYRHLDSTIREEKDELLSQMSLSGDSLVFNQNAEWEELEHNQAEVDPIFLQVVNNKGKVVFHSKNLLNDFLLFADSLKSATYFNLEFNGKKIRQGQFPVKNENGKIIGQLDIGVSQDDSIMILTNLRVTFFVAFPLMLLFFYAVTSLVASHGIAPVKKLIDVAGTINHNTINERLPLPVHKDEIYHLTASINALLERIEVGLTREKQITSDISHELRTPLTSIKGTLEVLVRKPREPKQYEEKVRQVIREVDTIDNIINQLLYLARLDSGNLSMIKKKLNLQVVLQNIKSNWQLRLDEKKISMKIDVPKEALVNADLGLMELILGNLIGNAVKYGSPNGSLVCQWQPEAGTLWINDNGPGIPTEHLPRIFDRFYRVSVPGSTTVQSTGLGLYIVKMLADIQGIEVQLKSKPGQGTGVALHFK